MVLSVYSVLSQLLTSAVFDSSRRTRWQRHRVSAHPISSIITVCIIISLFVGDSRAAAFSENAPLINMDDDLPARIAYFTTDGLRLNCSIFDKSLMRKPFSSGDTIFWYRMSENKPVGIQLKNPPTKSNSYYTISPNAHQLTIHGVSSSEGSLLSKIGGSYYCQVKDKYGVTRSRTCVVTPVSPAISISKIKIRKETALVYNGGTAVLSCKILPEYAIGYYTVIGWEIQTGNSKKVITESDDKYSLIKRIYPSELHIRRTSELDAQKIYRCILRSTIRQLHNQPNTKKSPDMKVTISSDDVSYYSPKLHSSHINPKINALSGTNVELPCLFYTSNSNTRFQYVWSHNKERIYPLSKPEQHRWRSKYQIVSPSHGNLRIMNVNRNDQGEYKCSFTDEGSGVSKSASKENQFATISLTVSSPLRVKVTPPRQKVDYLTSSNLTCEVHGYPCDKIYWLKDGEELKTSPNVRFSPDNKHVYIDKVERDAGGVYQCFAQNGLRKPQDNAQSRTVLQIMKMPPLLTYQYPIPESGKKTGYFKLTTMLNNPKGVTSVRLRCEFNGSPDLRITWALDGSRIPLDGKVIDLKGPPWADLEINLDHTTHEKPPEKYGGMYVAKAENPYGAAECRTYIELDTEMMIKDFKDINPIEGRDFRLNCYVVGNGGFNKLQISWTKKPKNGRSSKLPNNHRHKLEDNGRVLLIKNVKKEEDDGTYTCKALNKAGKESEKSVDFNVNRLPIINSFDAIHHLDEDRDKVTITCNIKNQANKPWYAWWVFTSPEGHIQELENSHTKEGVEITYSQNKDGFGSNPLRDVPKFVPPNTWVMLEIEKPVKEKHTGNYTCIIRNKVGKSNSSASVTFKPKIKFAKKPDPEKSVILSNDLTIDCTAKGKKPKPTVEWKYFNKSENQYISIRTLKEKTKNRISQKENGTLIVRSISRDDPTQYMCYVSLDVSDAEAISQVVKVTVQYPARIEHMKDVERRVGQNFNITCHITGDAKIDSQWLYLSEDTNKYELIRSPCVGSGDNREVLPCTNPSHGHYGAFSDIFRSKFKSPTGRGIIHVLKFTSVSSEHPKRYKCKARNKYNADGMWAEQIVKLTVIDTPSKPERIATKEYTARSITLIWGPPKKDGNKPIIYYRVAYSRYKDDDNRPDTLKEMNVTAVKGQRTYNTVIRNLHPAYEYRLEVQAVNAVGSSKVASITQRTQEDKPSGPVQNISANGTSSNTIRVSWLEPAPDKVNGRLTDYVICLMKADADSGSTYKNSVDIAKLNWDDRRKLKCKKINLRTIPKDSSTTSSQVEFTMLPKFTKYYIRVYARNNVGKGPPAFTSARTLEDVPREPPVKVTCTPGTTSVRLLWNPPNQDSMNGILTGYSIQYFETNDFEDESHSKINISSSTTTEVKNLQIFTNYTFRIFAVNIKGSGPPSEPITCLTKPSSPDPPREVKFFAVNSSCLVVSWKHPAHSNGRLTSYQVEYGKDDDLRTEIVVVPANTSAFFNYKFLCYLLRESYFVRVRAMNHAPLFSTYTPKKHAQTMGDVPARILAFNQSVTTTDNTDLSLSCEHIGTNIMGPSWEWRSKDGEFQELQGGTWLHLNSIRSDQGGEYICKVSNHLGEDQVVYNVEVHVIKKTPPNPPVLKRGRQRLHSLEVEWVPAGSSQMKARGLSIKHYWLTYSNLMTNVEEEIMLPATNRTYFLSKLSCATVVQFWIRAENSVGKSLPSNKVSMRTLGSHPIPGDTSKLYNRKLSRTSVYINLSEVFGPGEGCQPLQYRIWLTPLTVKMTRTPKLILKYEDLENQCCYNITGLNTGSRYNYRIEASNAAGGTNITGQLYTLTLDGNIPLLKVQHDQAKSSIWSQPPFLVGLIFAIIIIVAVALGLVLIYRRRQIQLRLGQGEKGSVRTCVNDLKGDEGKPESGLHHQFVTGHISGPLPTSQIRPRPSNDIEEELSDDGSVDSEGNINPYATFATYESNTLDRTEHTDGGPKELGAVSIASGQMRERMLPHNPSRRKRTAYYEAHGLPKQYENESVPGTLTSKRRSNSMEDIESAYNRGYATGGGGQMGRSYYESKYTDGLTSYRGNSSVISSTTMSSNHDELSQAYEYGRRARLESGLNPQDAEDNLDLHTGSGSSETTDPGIRQFTQQPPMPDEQRQATCEVPLIINQRRTSINPSETYEAVDEAYYKRGVQRQPMNYPARHAPLPELPSLSTTTLGRPRMTAAGIRAGQFRHRTDSDSVYGGQGHVYDSTDSYYSSYTPNNFGRRPIGATGGAGVEYPRQRNAPQSRYYNGSGAAAERRPLVGATAATPAAVSRPMPYGAHAIPGADPEESRSLLMNNRRYSGSRGRDSGVGTSGGGDSSSSIPPLSSRRPSRPVASTARSEAAPPVLQPIPRPDNSDSEGENIYTSEFTVV